MTFDEYQDFTSSTATYPKDKDVPYCILGLTGEAGEIANKYKKVIRDEAGVLTNERRAQLADELGDVMWYVAQLAKSLNSNLSEIVDLNVNKLKSRKERNVISGSGDNR